MNEPVRRGVGNPLPRLAVIPRPPFSLTQEEVEGKDGRRCPIPDELKRFPVWAGCGEWAYAAHPKGFRWEQHPDAWMGPERIRCQKPVIAQSVALLCVPCTPFWLRQIVNMGGFGLLSPFLM